MRKVGPLVQSGEKYCFRCTTVKTVGEFYSNRSAPDRRASQCKVCVKAARAASRTIKDRMAEAQAFFATRSGVGMIELPAVVLEWAAS